MNIKVIHLLFFLTSGLFCGSALAQQASLRQEDHFAGVEARGDQGMGFSHERTTHHFHLFSDGGSIEIASNDAADAESQKAIRDHLSMIAERFSQGDFAIPMFIHATIPPGIETMKRLNKRISCLAAAYRLSQLEDTPTAEVRKMEIVLKRSSLHWVRQNQ